MRVPLRPMARRGGGSGIRLLHDIAARARRQRGPCRQPRLRRAIRALRSSGLSIGAPAGALHGAV